MKENNAQSTADLFASLYDCEYYSKLLRANAKDHAPLAEQARAFCLLVKLPDAADRIREERAKLHKATFKGASFRKGGVDHAGACVAWDTAMRSQRRAWADMGYKVKCSPTGKDKDQYTKPAVIERIKAAKPAANAKGKRPNVVQQMRDIIKHLPPDQQTLHAWELLGMVQRETGQSHKASDKAADRCRVKVKAAAKQRKAS